ncbi:MAG: hypothetical protein CL908_18340 [Deltaproteobacteria bacterium]|nr:hypothetical protein [Deltaproteobacteria bacterium]
MLRLDRVSAGERLAKPIVVEVRGQLPAAIETAFDAFRSIDLRTTMVGYSPLPAVSAIEDQTGRWDSVAESRIARLADGHGMLETLTAVERPRRAGAWRYEFEPRSILVRPAARLVLTRHWRPCMEQALGLAVHGARCSSRANPRATRPGRCMSRRR